MNRPVRYLTVALLLIAGLLSSAIAKADTYTDLLADRFNAGQHLVVDPNAKPMLPNGDEINRQILNTNRPIWVANVAKSETGIATPDAIKDALSRNSEFSGVILVIDGGGYKLRAYNVPWGVKNKADNLMPQMPNRRDLYATVSGVVSILSDPALWDPSATPPPAPEPQPATPINWGFLWVLLWLALGAVGLYGIYLAVRTVTQRRAEQRRVRDEVNESIIDVEAKVRDLSNEVLLGLEVTDQYTNAQLALSDAKAARDAGDYSSASAHLNTARRYLADALDTINPTVKPDRSATRKMTRNNRRRADVRVTTPGGETHTVSNNDYTLRRDEKHRYFYSGGEYQGVGFFPGWYPYPFWLPTWTFDTGSVVFHPAPTQDHWGGVYGDTPKTSSHTSHTSTATFDNDNSSSRHSSYSSSSSSSSYDSSPSYTSSPSSVDFGGFSGGSSSGFSSGFSGGSDAGFN